MFCREGQHLQAARWLQGGEAFSWLCVWEEEEEKAAVRLATSLKQAAENLLRGTTTFLLLSAQGNWGSCGSEQTGALAGCRGSVRWPSAVVQPRRTGGCSLSAICACQAPAKTAPRRNPHRRSLSFWQARSGRWGRSGTKLCLKKDY